MSHFLDTSDDDNDGSGGGGDKQASERSLPFFVHCVRAQVHVIGLHA